MYLSPLVWSCCRPSSLRVVFPKILWRSPNLFSCYLIWRAGGHFNAFFGSQISYQKTYNFFRCTFNSLQNLFLLFHSSVFDLTQKSVYDSRFFHYSEHEEKRKITGYFLLPLGIFNNILRTEIPFPLD